MKNRNSNTVFPPPRNQALWRRRHRFAAASILCLVVLYGAAVGGQAAKNEAIPAQQAAPKRIDTFYDRVAGDLRAGRPLVVTIYVALCDNDSQGIMPVKNRRICEGDVPEENLYWGLGGGLKEHLKQRSWEKLLYDSPAQEKIAVRGVWLHRSKPGGALRERGVSGPLDVYIVGLAYRGTRIRDAMIDYLHAVSRDDGDSLALPNGKTIDYGGRGQIIGYIGHDYFMDVFDTAVLLKEARGNSTLEKGVFGLACFSDRYFRPAVQRPNTHILALNNNLTFPSAYTALGIIDGVAAGKSHRGIRWEAAKAFAKGQQRPAEQLVGVFSYGDKELEAEEDFDAEVIPAGSDPENDPENAEVGAKPAAVKPASDVDRALARWKSGLPKILLPQWSFQEAEARKNEMENGCDCTGMERVFQHEMPNPKDRALAMYMWVGSVQESWDDSHGLDRLADCLFWGLPFKAKVEALGNPELSDTRLMGAARLFADNYLSEATPTPGQKKRLLRICEKSPFPYNREKCRTAFDPALDKSIGLLDGWDFNKPGYAIIGLANIDQPNRITNRIGNFYVDAAEDLKMLKQKWRTGRTSPFFACGYHYFIYVVYNGKKQKEIYLNLDEGCNTIGSEGINNWFEPELIERFARIYKKPVVENLRFATLEDGRKKIEPLRGNRELLMDLNPEWTKFDGEFHFEYPCERKTVDGGIDQNRCVKEADAETKKAYPEEPFEMEATYWDDKGPTVSITVRSRKSLYEKIKSSSHRPQPWRDYYPYLTVVWKNSHKDKDK